MGVLVIKVGKTFDVTVQKLHIRDDIVKNQELHIALTLLDRLFIMSILLQINQIQLMIFWFFHSKHKTQMESYSVFNVPLMETI